MASLPPIRKLYIEDYQSQKGWIGPFLITLNTFMTAVVSSFTAALTLVENTTSDIKTVTLSSVPTPGAPAAVSWSKSQPPVAILVGQVQRSPLTALTLSAAVQVQWQMAGDGKSIQLTNVAGITPTQSSQYSLTLICIAG